MRYSKSMNVKTDAFLRLHGSILLAGCTGLFGRFIQLTELPLVWYRVMIGALVLGMIMWGGKQLRMPSWRNLCKIIGCGILLSVHWVFFYGSIKAANVSIGVVCFALVGFFTALLEPFINHHSWKWRELGLSMITVVGIVLIFGLDPRYRYGILLGVVSSILYSLFSIYSKRVVESSKENASNMLLFELLGGFIILSIALIVWCWQNPQQPWLPSGNDLWLLPLFASVFTVLPFLLQLQALRKISAFTVNLSYNLEPIYSIILATIFFGEAYEMGLSFGIGVGLIILSVALQTMISQKTEIAHE